MCFISECPKHDSCLKYYVGRHLCDKRKFGHAVYHAARKGGDCAFFTPMEIIHAAYGFAPLFEDVKQKDCAVIRKKIMDYLGGHTNYYRCNSGEKLITPEQQKWILDLFAEYGYDKNMSFAGYEDTLAL